DGDPDTEGSQAESKIPASAKPGLLLIDGGLRASHERRHRSLFLRGGVQLRLRLMIPELMLQRANQPRRVMVEIVVIDAKRLPFGNARDVGRQLAAVWHRRARNKQRHDPE